MILGMSTATFTLLHVVLSLIGILAGLVVLYGMLQSKRLVGWTTIFLTTTVLTTVTGFFSGRSDIAVARRRGRFDGGAGGRDPGALRVRPDGSWRWIYVAGAVLALHLNVFVGVVQAFQKLAFL